MPPDRPISDQPEPPPRRRSPREPDPTTWEGWAKRIKAVHKRGVENLIAIGKMLLRAKDRLPPGHWLRMINSNRFPFGEDEAQRLMKIAKHPVLSNNANLRYLPDRRETLVQLTRVDKKLAPGALQAMIDDGRVNPKTKGKDVTELLRTRPLRLVRNPGDYNKARAAYKNYLRPLTAVEMLQELRTLEIECREFMQRVGVRIVIEQLPEPEPQEQRPEDVTVN